jgi:hypothetical protein
MQHFFWSAQPGSEKLNKSETYKITKLLGVIILLDRLCELVHKYD